MPSSPAVEALAVRLEAAAFLVLLLDYDGTLVPFAPTPELAGPDDDLVDLLRDLAARPATETHIVSGRPAEALEQWLGALPIGLHGEHGFSSRLPGAAAWSHGALPAQSWRPPALALMRAFTARTPGSLVEEKHAGIVWHYRLADAELARTQAAALEQELAVLLDGAPVRIVPGAMIVEVVARGVDKGRLVPALVARAPVGSLVVAMGDDQTDEDLFAALPEGSLAVHVGPEPSRAPVRLDGVEDVRALLRSLVGRRPS
jgi:trehalose 6-phosphate synthase/phosphatase